MTTLFGDEPKAKRAKRKEGVGFDAVGIWVDEYRARWMTQLKRISGHDAKCCYDSAEEAGDEGTYRKMIQCFFDATDRKFLEEGHRVQDLERCKNRWKQEASQR